MEESYIRYCNKNTEGKFNRFCISEAILSLWGLGKKYKTYKVGFEIVGNVEDLGVKKGHYFGVQNEDGNVQYIYEHPTLVRVCFPVFPKDSEILVLKVNEIKGDK